MTNENLNSTRPDENLFASLLNEIKGLRAELDDLRKGLEAPKIHLEPDVLYNNKEIRLLLGVEECLIKLFYSNLPQNNIILTTRFVQTDRQSRRLYCQEKKLKLLL